jgi:hypothetical protein
MWASNRSMRASKRSMPEVMLSKTTQMPFKPSVLVTALVLTINKIFKKILKNAKKTYVNCPHLHSFFNFLKFLENF